ncbi:-domain-containing protein [Ceraceosorus bombacis]|uniref:-domain-containing protein n=1 Tax=Ceraceosorus bombacis TaxID=401625 RepID=A0A0N7LA92_9BASI|nr:-domain-containing protein [Ceraceosorus bombacis]
MSTVVGSPSGQHTHTSSIQQRASPTEIATQQAESRPSLQQPRSPSPGRWDGQQNQYGPGRSSPHKKLSSSPGTSSRDPSPSRQPGVQTGQAQGGRPPAPANQPPPVPAQQHQLLSQQQYRQPHAPGAIVPIRPAFARHNTDVRIRDDGPLRQPSGDEVEPHALDAVTLADIPQLLEAEQLREQRRALPEGVRSIAELSALELFIVKHMAVMMLQQSALKDLVNLDDLVDVIDMRKNTFWGKLFKGGKDDKKVKKKGVFAIPLEILVERSGADSTLGASASQLRIPSFVDDIVSAMRQMDMSIEGIFRKNGNIRRLATSAEALDRDSAQVNLSDDNPVQLAALLKKFLRELPDPLLTFKLHRLFVMSQKLEPESERHRIMHLITVLLPKPHRDTMEVLFVFLKWVASFSHIDEETGSKMDLQNLATVLGPNILYSKGTDPAKDETFLANRAVLDLLEHQDDYWLVPPGLDVALQDRDLLNSSAELTSRDILKNSRLESMGR